MLCKVCVADFELRKELKKHEMTELKEMLRLQKEMNELKNVVTNLKKQNFDLIEEIEKKERFIHELKKKSPGECTYGCSKYNKSVDEIVNAGTKHREKLLAIKQIAEDQKEKIRLLRNQKSSLENDIDKLTDDLEMEQKYVHTIQMDSSQKINKLKNELKACEEANKVLGKEKAENLDRNKSLSKKNDELISFVEKNEQALKVKEEEVEIYSKKLDFLKPKLECSLKENQSLNTKIK